MKKRLCTLIISAATIASSMFAAPSILTIKESITDNSIVYPESFETDTQEMLKNWYIQNYTVLDQNVENLPTNDVSDAIYIKRLKSMPTVIEMPFNQIVKKYIQMYTQKKRTLVETMLGMSLYYMPIFEQALEKEGLPLELKYLPVIESALNPNAISRVGATGLWQFMLGTAKNVGLEVNSLVDERRDPYRSSDKAAQYLKSLHNIYNDWSLAIAAYNCGPGNVNKALRRAGNPENKDFWTIYPYLPAETRGYVPAFIAANYVMTYFKEHNISPTLAKRPLITDTLHVTKRVNLQQISDVLSIPMEEIQVLNPHFRQNVIPGDIRPYSLTLPSQQVYSYIMSEDSIVAHNANLYAQRLVVEPSSYESPTSERVAYTKTVVKYHKVRRGETIGSIAGRYGMSVSQVKKLNGLRRSSLKRGQRVKVNAKVTAYRYKSKKDEVEADNKEEYAEDTESEDVVEEEEVVETPKVTRNNSKSKRVNKDEETASTSSKKSVSKSKKSANNDEEVATKSSKKKGKKGVAEEKNSSKKDVSKSKKSANNDEEVASTSSKKKGKKDIAEDKSSSKKNVSKSKKGANNDEEVASTSSKKKNKKDVAEDKNSSKKDKDTTASKSKSKKNNKDSEETASSSSKKKNKKDTTDDSKSSKNKKSKKENSYRNHTVKSGESLSTIADKYPGVSISDLRKANGISGNKIKPGEKLKVPRN